VGHGQSPIALGKLGGSSLNLSAIDEEFHAAHDARLVRCEERYRVGDLLGPAASSCALGSAGGRPAGAWRWCSRISRLGGRADAPVPRPGPDLGVAPPWNGDSASTRRIWATSSASVPSSTGAHFLGAGRCSYATASRALR
jgi:hypothetical protein